MYFRGYAHIFLTWNLIIVWQGTIINFSVDKNKYVQMQIITIFLILLIQISKFIYILTF